FGPSPFLLEVREERSRVELLAALAHDRADLALVQPHPDALPHRDLVGGRQRRALLLAERNRVTPCEHRQRRERLQAVGAAHEPGAPSLDLPARLLAEEGPQARDALAAAPELRDVDEVLEAAARRADPCGVLHRPAAQERDEGVAAPRDGLPT